MRWRNRRARATRDLAPGDIGEALAEVRAIYDELAARPIDRACALRTECCHFGITGKTPYLTLGEAMTAAKGFRAAGRKRLPEYPDGQCPLLHPQSHRCLIYADRPFGCRTHFCAAAGGPWDRGPILDLICRLEAIDARLGGEGPRALPVAVADALSRRI